MFTVIKLHFKGSEQDTSRSKIGNWTFVNLMFLLLDVSLSAWDTIRGVCKAAWNIISDVKIWTFGNIMFLVLDVCLPAVDIISDVIVLSTYWSIADFDWVIF